MKILRGVSLLLQISLAILTQTRDAESHEFVSYGSVMPPCDSMLPATNSSSCEVYYGQNTALSLKPSKCPAGELSEKRPPVWWHSCTKQTGTCPSGCGTCKKPNYSQSSTTCMCAGSDAECTADCHYPGYSDTKDCAALPCQQSNLAEAGCILLGSDCGAGLESKCVTSEGTTVDCTFPEIYDGGPCTAFCRQVPSTDECETIRNYHWVSVSTGICPANAITKPEYSDDSSSDITYLPIEYNRCAQDNPPYPPDPTLCVKTDSKPEESDQSLSKNITFPSFTCRSLGSQNRGSKGFPEFFTNLLVPPDASATCQNACACNTNEGFGPPNCFYAGEPYPGPVSCCYCKGKNIAYDTSATDSCGHYLPIFGLGTIPSQAICYEDYILDPDHPDLINSFPQKDEYICVNATADVASPVASPVANPDEFGDEYVWGADENVPEGGSQSKNEKKKKEQKWLKSYDLPQLEQNFVHLAIMDIWKECYN